ncbi:uncharacterized protein [Antedon mediterranea]|uniref:uncharacterized protein isoform X2 n=1 Tax=Antedon mediterranea TaxID=105859 RepID=UPI003AF4326A
MWKILCLIALISFSSGIDALSITCPTNLTSNNVFKIEAGLIHVRNDVGQNFATVTWDAPTVTNSNGEVNVTSSSYKSGDQLSIGLKIITFTAVDSGNTAATCDISIKVSDVEAPNCSIAPVSVSAPDGEINVTITFVITVRDNVLVSKIETDHDDVYISDSGKMYTVDSAFEEITSTGTFAMGETSVPFTVTDTATPIGNQASCAFNVTVNEFTPTTLPPIHDVETTALNHGNRIVDSLPVVTVLLCLYSFVTL